MRGRRTVSPLRTLTATALACVAGAAAGQAPDLALESMRSLFAIRDSLTAALHERVPLLDLFARYMIDLELDAPHIEIDPKTLQARVEAF